MEKRFIVIVWHQAGGRNDHNVYYTWSDENDVTYTFESEKEAKNKWHEDKMGDWHAGFVINCDTSEQEWI